jgi:K+ potassium transporter
LWRLTSRINTEAPRRAALVRKPALKEWAPMKQGLGEFLSVKTGCFSRERRTAIARNCLGSCGIQEGLIPLDTFMAKLEQDRVPRVPGTAVFLTRAMRDTPPVLVWHVRHNRALQQHVLAITNVTESVPWMADEKRVTFTQAAPNFCRAVAHYGFMERPDIPHLLAQLKDYGCNHRPRRRHLLRRT